MSFITKSGSFWGFVPQTSGRVFWKAPSATYTVEGRSYSASDANDGLTPERAVLTGNQAVTLCTANVGDVIMYLPGAHSETTTTTVNVAGISIFGIRRGMPLERSRMPSGPKTFYSSVTVSTAATNTFTVTAADIEIAYLHFIPIATSAGIKPSAAASRLYVHDCTWSMVTAADTATIGIDGTWTGTSATLADVIVRNCYFAVKDNNGPAVRMQGTTLDLVVENSTFFLAGDTAWDDAIELVSTSLGTVIRDCDFVQRSSGTVITTSINNGGATIDGSTSVLRCYFAVGTNALTATNVADNQCAENYLMQAAANVGGTLILCT